MSLIENQSDYCIFICFFWAFVCPSLNPLWGELFRFEVVNDLQYADEPLELTVWDKDTYTADDAIGSVLIDLNALATSTGTGTGLLGPDGISGYFPIYDSFLGVRGHLHLSIKLNFFADAAKESSAGVHLFAGSTLDGWEIDSIHGFVEELILDKDPEFAWIDSFRASRTSNDARLKLFNMLSARVARNVGRKAMELGGNCVLGFSQTFDLEGEIGIVVRASGTAVTIRPIGGNINGGSGVGGGGSGTNTSSVNNVNNNVAGMNSVSSGSATVAAAKAAAAAAIASTVNPPSDKPSLLDSSSLPPPTSSAVDVPGVNVSGRPSLVDESADAMEEEEVKEVLRAAEEGSAAAELLTAAKDAAAQVVDSALISSALEQAQQTLLGPSALLSLPSSTLRSSVIPSSRHEYRREVHLLTLTSFPSSVQMCLGGIVCARAVKLLDSNRSGVSQRAHDTWWLGLRKEIKSHARALNCTTVIGYTETTTIHEDLIVLTAMGTAARVGWFRPLRQTGTATVNATNTTVPSSIGGQVGTAASRHAARQNIHSRSHRNAPPINNDTAPSAAAATVTATSNAASSAGVGSRARSRTIYTSSQLPHFSALKHHRRKQPPCAVTHVPYPRDSSAFRMALRPCAMCGKKFVPELLITSVELYSFNPASPVPLLGPLSLASNSGPASAGIVPGRKGSDGPSTSSVPSSSSPSSSLSQPPPQQPFPERDLFRVPVVGKGQLIEARVCRPLRRTSTEEQAAQAVSESLPFLEYELHRQLIYKLRVMGMNAAFGLRMQLVVGDNLLVGVSTATAVFLPSLPPPPLLLIRRYIGVENEEDRVLVSLQQKLMQLSYTNRAYWAAMIKQWRKQQKQKARTLRRIQRRQAQAQQQLLILQQQQQQQHQHHFHLSSKMSGTPHSGPGSPYHRGAGRATLTSPAVSPHHPLVPHPHNHHHHHHHHSSSIRAKPSSHASHQHTRINNAATATQSSSAAELALLRISSTSTEDGRSDTDAVAATQSVPLVAGPPVTGREVSFSQSTTGGGAPAMDRQQSTSSVIDSLDASPVDADTGVSGTMLPSVSPRQPTPHSQLTPPQPSTTSPGTLVEDGAATQVGTLDIHASGSNGGSGDPSANMSHLSPPDRLSASPISPVAATVPAESEDDISDDAEEDDESSSSSESSEGDEDLLRQTFVRGDVRSEFILQIDDEADEDLMSVLLEPTAPDHIELTNLECLPGMQPHHIQLPLEQNGIGTVSSTLNQIVDPLTQQQRTIAVGSAPSSPGKGTQRNRSQPSTPLHAPIHSAFSSPTIGPKSINLAATNGTIPVSVTRTSLPNVQLLTLVRRVEWATDVTSATALAAAAAAHENERTSQRDRAQRDRKDQQLSSGKGKKGGKLFGFGGATESNTPITVTDPLDDALLSGAATHKVSASLTGLNRLISSIYHDLYAALCIRVQKLAHPAYLAAIRSRVLLPAENTVEVVMTAMAVRQTIPMNIQMKNHPALQLPGWAGVTNAATDSLALHAQSTPLTPIAATGGPFSAPTERERARAQRRHSQEKVRAAGTVKSGVGSPSSSSSSSNSSSSSAESSDGGGGITGADRRVTNGATDQRTSVPRSNTVTDSPRRTAAKSTVNPAQLQLPSSALVSPQFPHSHRSHRSNSRAGATSNMMAANSAMTQSQRFGLFAGTLLAPQPPLPASLLDSIDPATHKALGMPLFIPPLTFAALKNFHTRVVRQVVELNALAGREPNSFSGLRQRLMLPPTQPVSAPAQTSAAPVSEAAALHAFTLEQAASAFAGTGASNNVGINSGLLIDPSPISTAVIGPDTLPSKVRTLINDDRNTSTPTISGPLSAVAGGTAASTSASTPRGLSILAAASLPLTSANVELNEMKEKRASEDEVKEDPSMQGTGGKSNYSISPKYSHLPLSIHLPNAALPLSQTPQQQSSSAASEFINAASNFSALLNDAQSTTAANAGSMSNSTDPSSLSSLQPANELLCVELTPMSFIPSAPVHRYLGRVCVHLIKECYSYREVGGLGSFVETFLLEMNQLVRAHVIARGGNALLSYTLQEFKLQRRDNAAYAILSVSGDAARCIKANQH
jgi:hypothetical protein